MKQVQIFINIKLKILNCAKHCRLIAKRIKDRKVRKTCIVMQEAIDALSKTADSDTVSTYQLSSVQLVTDKKLEGFNKA